jgi:hypothetical protein
VENDKPCLESVNHAMMGRSNVRLVGAQIIETTEIQGWMID